MSVYQGSRYKSNSLTLLLNPRLLLQVLHVSQSFLLLYLKTFQFSVNPRQLHITIGNGVFLLGNRPVEILQLLIETCKVSEFFCMKCLCSFQLSLWGNGVNTPNPQAALLNLHRSCVSLLVLVLQLLTHRFCCHLDIRDSLFCGCEIGLELLYFHVNKASGTRE